MPSPFTYALRRLNEVLRSATKCHEEASGAIAKVLDKGPSERLGREGLLRKRDS
ncbi:hypothetical protein [Bacillus phage SPO1L1]|nr:hypothetical protein [Bacillus phage SPO1L1]WIT26161.1 hypothetical protein [Bacillus phage SPO1L2]